MAARLIPAQQAVLAGSLHRSAPLRQCRPAVVASVPPHRRVARQAQSLPAFLRGTRRSGPGHATARLVAPAASAALAAVAPYLPPSVVFKEYAQMAAGVATLYALDKGLGMLFYANRVAFPAPLAGMFLIVGGLLALEAVAPNACEAVMDAFRPALNWINRWIPCFYAPNLIMLPLALRGYAAADLWKIAGINAGGVVTNLFFTGAVVIAIRGLVNTTVQPTPPMAKAGPVDDAVFYAWAGLGAASLAAFLGGLTAAAFPLFLASTVGGYLGGARLPEAVKAVCSPILVAGATAEAAAWVMGTATGAGYLSSLATFKTAAYGQFGTGVGDILMSFLGSVILSFGFRIFEQRALLFRHRAEVGGTVILSALFSLVSTALAGRALGLAPELTRAVMPRGVTIALALPMCAALGGASGSITAACVVFTGLVGANFCAVLLDRFGFRDPVVRGMATAGSAHGLGTAALALKEPEALPFCALAYALIAISGSVLCSIPALRAFLIALAG